MKSNIFATLTILLAAATVAQSRRWFAPEVNCWITQRKVSAPWKTAQRRCERHGAILASPLNTQLFTFMQSLISAHNHSAAYFIGTRAKHSDDDVHYVSVEGRRLSDMPRAVFDAIDQLDLEQGECLSMDRHGIRAVSCLDHLPYICYSNETTECGSAPAPALASTTATSAPRPSTTTPPGYRYKAATGSSYKLHRRTLSWYNATAACEREGARLLVLNDLKEADVIARMLRDLEYSTWTGFQNTRVGEESVWRTAYGEALSEMFHVQPYHYSYKAESEKCAEFSYTKIMSEAPCTSTYSNLYFICELSQ